MTAQALYRMAALLTSARGIVSQDSDLKLKYMAYNATAKKWPIRVKGFGDNLRKQKQISGVRRCQISAKTSGRHLT